MPRSGLHHCFSTGEGDAWTDILLPEPRLRPFQVTVEYEDIEGTPKTDTYSLDVSQFAEWSILGQPTDHEMAEALKNIERHFDGCVSGLLRLKVETMTAAEVKRESGKAQDEAKKHQTDPDP